MWWQTTGPDGTKKIVWDVWCQALEMPEELRWFPVAHFLMREDVSRAIRVKWTTGALALLSAGRRARAAVVKLSSTSAACCWFSSDTT
jgi:hypothetical protein